MSYQESERQKAVAMRHAFFGDPGNGQFLGKKREFVLARPELNLWEGIRNDAKEYFKIHKIPWWQGTGSGPTGHLLSSQIACLNHLFYVCQRKDIATALLKRLVPEIEEALKIDGGYIEFEYIGKKQYLKEKWFRRGANCTSLDAVMLGRVADNRKILFLIEWKYTEHYRPVDKYIAERARVYDAFITSSDGPFIPGLDPQSLYFEPFYQMMRQTLLGWFFRRDKQLDYDRCINVHVIPDGNADLKKNITSPHYTGEDIHAVWKSLLREPDSYMPVDPESWLKSAVHLEDVGPWLSYLGARYW